MSASRAIRVFQKAAKEALDVRLSEGGILHAAVEVFAKRGFAATRVEDILEASGIARRTFYKYFAGKEAVLASIYEIATGELLKAVAGAARGEGADDPLSALELGLDAYLDYHQAHGALVRILAEQAIRTDSPLFPLRAQFRQSLVGVLDAAVQQARGEKLDPYFYVGLISAVEGVSLELLSKKTPAAEVERAKRALHLLLDRSLRAAAPTKR
ncbi:MAG: TetR family transcriptional regulator [Myxococcota bacterium]